jgi:hypothetical protein
MLNDIIFEVTKENKNEYFRLDRNFKQCAVPTVDDFKSFLLQQYRLLFFCNI